MWCCLAPEFGACVGTGTRAPTAGDEGAGADDAAAVTNSHLPTMGNGAYPPTMREEPGMGMLVETDSRSRVVLPGHPNQRYLMIEQSDGTLLLEPALVVSAAQHEYDVTPELQDLLQRALQSPTVRRARRRR